MSSFIDYLKWRGDVPFSVASFNAVDAMILCEIVYYDFNGIVPSDFSDGTILLREAVKGCLKEPLPYYLSKEDQELCELLPECPRFSDIKMSGFVNRIEAENSMQFSAVTFYPEKDLCFVSFRGTDDSLIGWKENLDLAYNDAVPAQVEAVKYLKEAAKTFRGAILVGGHSKGGNLAVYAAAFSGKRVGKRIRRIYNFDGPGFNERVIQDERFLEVAEKTHTFVPQDSVIGLLLEHKEHYEVIHSNASNGISQHRLVSWEVVKDDIVREEKISRFGNNYRENISEWLDSMSYDEKKALIDVIYDLVDEYKTTGDLFSAKAVWSIIREYRGMSDDNKKVVSGAVGDLKDTLIGNVKEKFDNVTKIVQDNTPKRIIQKGKDKLESLILDAEMKIYNDIDEDLDSGKEQ